MENKYTIETITRNSSVDYVNIPQYNSARYITVSIFSILIFYFFINGINKSFRNTSYTRNRFYCLILSAVVFLSGLLFAALEFSSFNTLGFYVSDSSSYYGFIFTFAVCIVANIFYPTLAACIGVLFAMILYPEKPIFSEESETKTVSPSSPHKKVILITLITGLIITVSLAVTSYIQEERFLKGNIINFTQGIEKYCKTHKEALQVDTVPLLYGLPLFPDGYIQARRKTFYNANSFMSGGFLVKHPQKAKVRFCPLCREEETKWFKKNHNDDLKSNEEVFQGYTSIDYIHIKESHLSRGIIMGILLALLSALFINGIYKKHSNRNPDLNMWFCLQLSYLTLLIGLLLVCIDASGNLSTISTTTGSAYAEMGLEIIISSGKNLFLPAAVASIGFIFTLILYRKGRRMRNSQTAASF
jgi:hypothetical protein